MNFRMDKLLSRHPLLGLLSYLFISSASFANVCETPKACVDAIPTPAEKTYGTGQADESLRERLIELGRDALPALVQATSDKNQNKRLVADYAISRIAHFDTDDWQLIVKAIDNNTRLDGDGGWSYGALGRFDASTVMPLIIKYLHLEGSIDNQLGTALSKLGADAAPAMIAHIPELASLPRDEQKKLLWVYHTYFDRMANRLALDLSNLAPELIAIASTDSLPTLIRGRALEFAGMCASNEATADQIALIAVQYPELQEDANNAFKTMGSLRALPPLMAQLDSPHSYVSSDAYNRLAEMGPRAYEVGPELIKRLNSHDPNTRINAAMTLGYIHYTPATEALIKLTHHQTDWKVVYAAVHGLARLYSPVAAIRLREIAEHYWYPPVATYAQQAVTWKGDVPPTNARRLLDDFPEPIQNPVVCSMAHFPKYIPQANSRVYRVDMDEPEKFSYRDPTCDNPNDDSEYFRDYCASERSLRQPFVAVEWQNVWFTGSDRGEWGGELMRFTQNGDHSLLMKENIEDIYLLNDALFITAGLAHLTWNNGVVYQIDSTDDLTPTSVFRLPGSPSSSWLINDKDILINTNQGPLIYQTESGTAYIPDCP